MEFKIKKGSSSTQNFMYAGLLVWTIALVLLAYGPSQSDFSIIISCYGAAFAAYLFLLKISWPAGAEIPLRTFQGWAVFIRVLLLFSIPNLSDDVYRFIWDGRLLAQGVNPFESLPSAIIENGSELRGIDRTLYAQLNSPDYFTIYPPVAQVVFAIACWVFPLSIGGSTLVMKLFLLIFEIGTIFKLPVLLKSLNIPVRNALLYILNPLVIIEIMGNLHFEGAMVFFFLLALGSLLQSKLVASGIFYGLSIASKLLTLLFLPLLLWRLPVRKLWVFYSTASLIVLLCFSPLLSDFFISNFGESLTLYFQKFEFNASMYNLLRWVGIQIKGYNLIHFFGPFLALLTFVSVVLIAVKYRRGPLAAFPALALGAIAIYLFLATTIHPWYLILPLVLCTFTHYRFPVVWSGLIFLTYINYSYAVYRENLWIVLLEYSVVLIWAGYEWRTYRNTDIGVRC